jgi:autotransporter translocation and assembly factor TamB
LIAIIEKSYFCRQKLIKHFDMKQIFIMLSLCVLLFGCTKDWGIPTTRNYPINAPYSGLDVSNAFQVTVSDQITDVVVTVGDLAHENVDVKVINGTLHIGFKPMTFNNYNGVATAVIPASVLRDLELSGASSFTGDLSGDDVDIDLSGASIYRGNVITNDLDLDLSGASTYIGTIDVDKLDADLSGASTVTVGGYGQSLMKINLSGGSQLNAANFEVPVVNGSMSGGSFADVNCCTSLNVSLSGGSTLIYGTLFEDCHPVVNCPTSGGSMVKPRG